MKFCDYCENMLYVIVDDDKELKYQCKNCNFVNVIVTTDKVDDDGQPITVLKQTYTNEIKHIECNECVMDINYVDDARNYNQYMNKNIKYDKTLPHVNNIKCPSSGCTKETDTIYIKYDTKNMKYLYFCCNCDTFWRDNK